MRLAAVVAVIASVTAADAEPSARVRLGQVRSHGDLDKAYIRRFVKHELPKLEACYDTALAKQPTLAGTIDTHFRIEASGKVSTCTATGVDADLASCVVGVIQAIQFPEPHGASLVDVDYPFLFSPKGSK